MKILLFISVFALVSCKFFPKDPNPGAVVDRGQMPAGYKICLIGDSGTGGDDQYLVGKALKNEKCNEVRILGDIVYPDGIKSPNDEQFLTKFYNPYQEILEDNTTFHLNMGNHDYKENPSAWLEIAKTYENIKFPSLYYLETYGSVCFFNLETNSYFVRQYKWIKKMKKKYKDQCKIAFAFGHHPRFSVGQHGDAIYAVKIFLSKAVEGKFDAYFAGHDHNQSDEGVIDGTHYFVSGAAGKLRPIKYPVKVWAQSALGYQTMVLNYDDNNEPFFNFYFYSVNEDTSVNMEHKGRIATQGLRF